MISVFGKYETKFEGVGNPVMDNWLSTATYHESLNGEKYIKLVIPHRAKEVDRSKIPSEFELIKIVDMNGEEDYFRVRKINNTLRTTTLKCEHISYDLIDNHIEDIFIFNSDGQSAINRILGNTQFQHLFKGFSNIDRTANIRMVAKNPINALIGTEDNTFVNRLGGEMKRLRYNISMDKTIGKVLDNAIRSRKNLTGFDREVDVSSVVTRIKPTIGNGIRLPELYVDSPLIGNYPNPIIKERQYTIEIEGQFEDLSEEEKNAIYEQMRQMAKKEFEDGADKPKATYKVTFVDLRKTVEYKDYKALETVSLGDTLQIFESDYGFNITAKVVGVEYDLLNKKYISITLGNHQERYTSNQLSNATAIASRFNELDGTINLALASADGKNTIYRGPDEPTNPDINDLWFKEVGSETHMMIYSMVDGSPTWVRRDITSEEIKAKFERIEQEKQKLLKQVSDAEVKAQLAIDQSGAGATLANEFETIIIKGGYASLKDAIGDVSLATKEELESSFRSLVYNPDGSLSINEQTAKYIKDSVIDDQYISNTIQTSDLILQEIKEIVSKNSPNLAVASNFYPPYNMSKENLTIHVNDFDKDTKVYIYISAEPETAPDRLEINYNWIDSTLSRNTLNKERSADGKAIYKVTITPKGRNLKSITIKKTPGVLINFVTVTQNGAYMSEWGSNAHDIAHASSAVAQMSDNINLKVSKGEIITQINLSTEGVLIDGKKLHVTGEATFDSGIITNRLLAYDINADKIVSGTIDASRIRVINIDADNISANKTNFIKSTWNRISSSVYIDAGGIYTRGSNEQVNIHDGKIEYFNSSGVRTGGTSSWYHNGSNYGVVNDMPINSGYAWGIGYSNGDRISPSAMKLKVEQDAVLIQSPVLLGSIKGGKNNLGFRISNIILGGGEQVIAWTNEQTNVSIGLGSSGLWKIIGTQATKL
ncbi:phage tail spike protein [Facklamia sp. P12945]|uniref:phage tail spike protein n=1 Tax=Facklamia sp. P12945 TaxID=3421950 RepID=UPI003D163227